MSSTLSHQRPLIQSRLSLRPIRLLVGLGGLLLGLSSCQSAAPAPPKEVDLDIVTATDSPESAVLAAADQRAEQNPEQGAGPALKHRVEQRVDQPAQARSERSTVATVPSNAATNWQAFFKAPPTVKQRSQLEQRLKRWPETGTAPGQTAKGRAELAVGRLRAAEASFREALRLKTDDLAATLELSALYLREQKVAEAFDLLAQAKEVLSTADDVPQSLLFKYRYTLALAYIARGERDKGHKVLSDLIAADKSFTPAYTSLAASYLAAGKDAVAEFVLRRGLDRVKDSASLLNLMGVIAQKSHDESVARSWFDKALKANATYAPALINRASLSASNFEYSAAEEDLHLALNVDPQSVDALVTLGVVQKRQGNISGAKGSFSKAVDLDADNAFARFNLAVLLADSLKKPDEAMRLFHEVLQTPSATSELRDLARGYISDLRPTGIPTRGTSNRPS